MQTEWNHFRYIIILNIYIMTICFNDKLHGPPMLVDKTNFGLMLYNHAPMLVDKTNFGSVLYNRTNFYRFEETSSYWSLKRISDFLCFSLVNQRHTSGITENNRTVTNIENTVPAVHSYNSRFFLWDSYCPGPKWFTNIGMKVWNDRCWSYRALVILENHYLFKKIWNFCYKKFNF